MLAHELWGQGRHLPMVILSHLAATSVDECCEVVKLVRNQSILRFDVDGKITRSEWEPLYRRPSSIEAMILGLLTSPENPLNESEALEYRQHRRQVCKGFYDGVAQSLSGKTTERERQLGERLIQRYYRRTHLPEIARQLQGDEPSPMGYGWLGNREFLFFMGIFAPCLILYQTTPRKLYRAAMRGDFQALERLVRLDPMMLANDRIADRLFHMQRQGAEGLKILHEAQQQGITEPITAAGMKYLIGGCLMRISQGWQSCLNGELLFELVSSKAAPDKLPEVMRWIKNHSLKKTRNLPKCLLTAPAIKALFDTLYEVSGKGRFDPDFQKEKKTVYRALDRNAKLCSELPIGNKLRAA